MSIGAQEIIALAILALLVFGPQRLPDIARQVGRAIAEVRRVSREFEREVKDVTDPFEQEIRRAERQAQQAYRVTDDMSRFEPVTPAPDHSHAGEAEPGEGGESPPAVRPPPDTEPPQEEDEGFTGPPTDR